MRSIDQMVRVYKRNLEYFWTGSTHKPDIDQMAIMYQNQITSLRDAQQRVKDDLNEAGVTGPNQATFQALGNVFWKLLYVLGYGGDTAAVEFSTVINLFTVKFNWQDADIALAKTISVSVFNVVIPAPAI